MLLEIGVSADLLEEDNSFSKAHNNILDTGGDAEDEEYDDFEDLEDSKGSYEETELTDEQLREKNAEEKENNQAKMKNKEENNDDEDEAQVDDLAKIKSDLLEQKKERMETLEGGLKFTGYQQVSNLFRQISIVKSSNCL